MKIIEVKNRISELINCLLEVWEGSVKATHLFLSDREIKNIKEYVPQALKSVEHLVIAEDEAGCPKAFMGIEDGSLEMLFVAPEERGKGLGKRLLRYGMPLNGWLLMNRTPRQKDSMNIWVFVFIKGQNWMNREILIRFYI